MAMVVMAGPRSRLLDRHEAAVGTGHRALDRHQELVGVDRDDAQVLDRHLLLAPVAGHALALEHLARVHAAADRAGTAVLAGAVRGLVAAEVVALHHAGEAAALAQPGDVDDLGRVEDAESDLAADGDAVD